MCRPGSDHLPRIQLLRSNGIRTATASRRKLAPAALTPHLQRMRANRGARPQRGYAPRLMSSSGRTSLLQALNRCGRAKPFSSKAFSDNGLSYPQPSAEGESRQGRTSSGYGCRKFERFFWDKPMSVVLLGAQALLGFHPARLPRQVPACLERGGAHVRGFTPSRCRSTRPGTPAC